MAIFGSKTAVEGRHETNRRLAQELKDGVGEILSVFTDTLDKLKGKRDQIMDLIGDNNNVINEAQAHNEELFTHVDRIDNVMGHISNILNTKPVK